MTYIFHFCVGCVLALQLYYLAIREKAAHYDCYQIVPTAFLLVANTTNPDLFTNPVLYHQIQHGFYLVALDYDFCSICFGNRTLLLKISENIFYSVLTLLNQKGHIIVLLLADQLQVVQRHF